MKKVLITSVIELVIIISLVFYIFFAGLSPSTMVEDVSKKLTIDTIVEPEDASNKQRSSELVILDQRIKDITQELNNCENTRDEYLQNYSDVVQELLFEINSPQEYKQKYDALQYRFESISKSINELNTFQREPLLVNDIVFNITTDAEEYISTINSDYILSIEENNGNPIKTYEWNGAKIIVENSTINMITMNRNNQDIVLVVGNSEISFESNYYSMISELSQYLEITIADGILEVMSYRLSKNYVLEILIGDNIKPNEVQVEEILIRRVGEL